MRKSKAEVATAGQKKTAAGSSDAVLSTVTVGKAGEERAVQYLKEKGYSLVARNWRKRGGEIDIIAQKGEILVFVEVKTLPSGNWETLQAELGPQKQKRIVETAKLFLLEHREYSNSIIRFDVIAVDMPGVSPEYHIEDAFRS